MVDTDYIVGIDLGTTNSVVAILENDQPRVITNAEGSTRTPSIVSFLESGEVVVGEIAKRQNAVNPHRTVSSVKRLMGRSLDDIERLKLRFPFPLGDADGQLLVPIGNAGYTPAQISAFVLRKLKQSAEDYLGEAVNKAVITVPAYFDDLQRQATREAGMLAGLEVLRLVNEPTAAAMAYGLGREGHERVAVYDFGGGTFDLTILDISDNTFEVLTSTGDTHLGGDDIDELIVQLLLQNFQKENNVALEPDMMALRRLGDAAEKAKCELSIARQTIVHLPFLTHQDNKPIHLETTITRRELEKLIRPMIERTIKFCRTALDDCELEPADLDKVILVGGTTRIPMVQDLVEDFFGIAPFKGINPDEIVALGAAAQAGVLAGRLQEVLLLDVTPHSLGVEITDGRVSRIIDKNSTIPIKAARLFTTTEDEQEMVQIHVVQGESDRAAECRSLGKFTLTGLQGGKAGVPRIQVTFHINADGMVEVSAEDLATNQQRSISLTIGGEEEAGERARSKKRRPRRRSNESRDFGDVVIRASSPAQTQSHHKMIRVDGEMDAENRFEGLHEEVDLGLKPIQLGDEHVHSMATQITDTATRRAMDRAESQSGKPVAPLSETATKALQLIRDKAASASAYEVYLRASEELREFVAANPDEGDVLETTIQLLIMLGEKDDAKHLLLAAADSDKIEADRRAVLLEQFLQKEPDDEEVLMAQSQTLSELNRTQEAVELLERVCSEEHGTDAQVERLILLYRKRLGEAEDGHVQFKLVKLLIRAGRIDEAINLLQRLVQTETYRGRSLKILGLCFWQKGLHYLAWQKFQQLPLNEEIADVLYRLSADMEDTDQLLNAKVVLQHLVDHHPDYKDVQQRLRKVEQLIKLESSDRDANMTPSIFMTLKDSRFVILEEINRGSMGIVYRAKDKVLEEIVALKILNDYMTGDPSAVERFKREARAAKRLSHPNIVRIHDMFEYGNKKLLSMEYISGMDVKKILQDRKTLPAWEIIGICRGVCEALSYAHKMNIAHRDVKPANIMITDANEIKVTDFGIAKFLLAGPDHTRSGSQIIGTPLYMSPEQIRGDQIDPRSDIYSLGATIYEMSSGKAPFCEGNIEYHHLHTMPAPLPADVPEGLAEVVLKCLAKAPDDRYQSIDEVSTALQAIRL